MITSVRNRQIVAATRLQKRGIREQHRRFLVEGAQATEEGLAAGAVETLFHVPGEGGRVADIVRRAGEAGVHVTAVSNEVLAHITSTVTPQPLVAIARFDDAGLDAVCGSPGIVPVLCSVRDPGNAGTIVRTADAAGAAGIVFAEASVDVYNPKTVRSSAGSVFHLPVVRGVTAAASVAALRDGGARVLAATADGRRSVFDADLTGPVAVLLGNEAWGLPDDVRDLADDTVRVPITGHAESLNLAAAATVVLFEAGRQRTGSALAATLADAAHDLRAPLVGVKGFASTLVARWEDLDDAERREAVELMAFDAERGAALVELVVSAARAEMGTSSPPDPARLEEVGATVVPTFARIPERPDLRWEAAGEVAVDARTVRAMVLVLVDVVSSGGGDEAITVRSEAGNDAVTVWVSREGATVLVEGGSLGLVARAAEAVGGGLETATSDRLALRLPD